MQVRVCGSAGVGIRKFDFNDRRRQRRQNRSLEAQGLRSLALKKLEFGNFKGIVNQLWYCKSFGDSMILEMKQNNATLLEQLHAQ